MKKNYHTLFSFLKNSIAFLVGLFFIQVDSYSQTKVGITMGFNLPYQYYKYSSPPVNYEDRYKMIKSFQAGVITNIHVSKKINFQPCLVISGKGSKHSYYINGIISRKQKLTYLEMQLPVNYKFTKNIFLGAGPALSYGLSGKDTSNIEPKFDPFDEFIKRFDFGLLLQAGIPFKNFQVSCSYNLGLKNMFYSKPSVVSLKNRVLNFSLTYFFKKPLK